MKNKGDATKLKQIEIFAFLNYREYKPPASFDIPEDLRVTLYEWDKNSGNKNDQIKWIMSCKIERIRFPAIIKFTFLHMQKVVKNFSGIFKLLVNF